MRRRELRKMQRNALARVAELRSCGVAMVAMALPWPCQAWGPAPTSLAPSAPWAQRVPVRFAKLSGFPRLRLPRYSAGPCQAGAFAPDRSIRGIRQVEAWLQERGFAKKVESRPSSKSWNSGGELQRRENHICAGQDELSAKFRSIQVSSRAESCT